MRVKENSLLSFTKTLHPDEENNKKKNAKDFEVGKRKIKLSYSFFFYFAACLSFIHHRTKTPQKTEWMKICVEKREEEEEE